MTRRAIVSAVAPSIEIYRELAAHQVANDDWELRELLATLHEWAEVFIARFKLELTDFTIAVDWVTRRAYGLYRPGHDGLGLRAAITLNRRYLTSSPFWKVLGTLLHELLHGWQEKHGTCSWRGNYHNKEFRDKAKSLGLLVDARGYTQYLPDSPFTRLLEERGVTVPAIPEPVSVVKERGDSKLKKWTCGCTNARVARRDFAAMCLQCGNRFVLCDPPPN